MCSGPHYSFSLHFLAPHAVDVSHCLKQEGRLAPVLYICPYILPISIYLLPWRVSPPWRKPAGVLKSISFGVRLGFESCVHHPQPVWPWKRDHIWALEIRVLPTSVVCKWDCAREQNAAQRAHALEIPRVAFSSVGTYSNIRDQLHISSQDRPWDLSAETNDT